MPFGKVNAARPSPEGTRRKGGRVRVCGPPFSAESPMLRLRGSSVIQVPITRLAHSEAARVAEPWSIKAAGLRCAPAADTSLLAMERMG